LTFAKQGWPIFAGLTCLSAAAGVFFGPWVFAAGMLAAVAALAFFRDPLRQVPGEEGAVIAPADGRIVAVTQGAEPHRFSPEATTKVSIFMSPLDVHINRSPVKGIIERIEHKSGRFRAAYADDASEVNESNSVLIKSEQGYAVVVVQIAGWLARRIICYASEKSAIGRGERFGLIMFGSRVDVFLPPRARALVNVGDRTRGGETILAFVDDVSEECTDV